MWETLIILVGFLLFWGVVRFSDRGNLEEVISKPGEVQKNKTEERELLAEVKKVPASDWETNRDLYEELMELSPQNAGYKKKYSYYSNKMEKRLLVEVKKVPASDWETNRDLYDELFELRPQNVSYRKKHNFYQEKLDKKQEAKLRAKVARVPSSDWQKNKDLYSALMIANPNEPQYKKKYEFYEGKIERQNQYFGDHPIKTGWTTISYLEVKNYLNRTAHDPDSIEIDACTKVFRSKKGWLVGCQYRGRNGFGGMVRKANWFTIRQGSVVKVDPASAYKWQ